MTPAASRMRGLSHGEAAWACFFISTQIQIAASRANQACARCRRDVLLRRLRQEAKDQTSCRVESDRQGSIGERGMRWIRSTERCGLPLAAFSAGPGDLE